MERLEEHHLGCHSGAFSCPSFRRLSSGHCAGLLNLRLLHCSSLRLRRLPSLERLRRRLQSRRRLLLLALKCCLARRGQLVGEDRLLLGELGPLRLQTGGAGEGRDTLAHCRKSVEQARHHVDPMWARTLAT